MKKWFVLLLSVAILALTPVTIIAQGFETYQLKDLRMSIDIPIAYDVATRNTREDDPVYERLGTSKEEMDALLEKTDTYLYSYNPNTGTRIRVIGTKTEIKDFNRLGDDELETVISKVISETTEMGIVPESAELYQHKQVLFIRLYSRKKGLAGEDQILSYVTVVDGKRIDILLSSVNGEITETDEERFKNIIDLVHFDWAATATTTSIITEGIILWTKAGLAFFVALLLAFPTILFRLILKNKEISLKKRRIFFIIYVACAVLMLALIAFGMQEGGTVIIGGFIYMGFLTVLALIRKKKKERKEELEREKIEEEQAMICLCPACGAEFPGTHLYCPKCGAKRKIQSVSDEKKQ